eukprot:GGOE01026338.1.p5 GENE.GGOE01026338.1~~GGOE01026338.1.p5  ORF type:complete len:123 (-),score=3.49 GGOE01026338.1:606-974(-)
MPLAERCVVAQLIPKPWHGLPTHCFKQHSSPLGNGRVRGIADGRLCRSPLLAVRSILLSVVFFLSLPLLPFPMVWRGHSPSFPTACRSPTVPEPSAHLPGVASPAHVHCVETASLLPFPFPA